MASLFIGFLRRGLKSLKLLKLLKDVFQQFQLYDLAEMLEKVKSRWLRPSLPMKETKKLLNVSERPSKIYS